MNDFLHILEDTIIDAIKILPFLLIAYLIMEYIEHKTTNKTREAIKKSGRFGPLIGGILGAFPQCGFSVTATNLYAGRVITLRNFIFSIFIYFRRDASNTIIRRSKWSINIKNTRYKNTNWNNCWIFNRYNIKQISKSKKYR